MRKSFILLFILIVVYGCKKDKNLQLIDGIYTGSFKIIGNSTSKTGNVTLTINDANFICQAQNNNLLIGGSGIYTINENIVNFTDINARNDLFVYNLLLSGFYTYSFDGKNLKIFTEKNGPGYYELNLVKQ